MQRAAALRTAFPRLIWNMSLATSWERRNYTNIGKVTVYVPPNVTCVEGMSGYLPSRDLLWRSHNLFISGMHIRDRSDNQHHSVRPVAKYASRGNAITMTRPISGLCTRVPVFAKINQSWEQQVYHSYILGSLYTSVKYIKGGDEAQSAQRTDGLDRKWQPDVHPSLDTVGTIRPQRVKDGNACRILTIFRGVTPCSVTQIYHFEARIATPRSLVKMYPANFCQTTRRHVVQYRRLHSHRQENTEIINPCMKNFGRETWREEIPWNTKA